MSIMPTFAEHRARTMLECNFKLLRGACDHLPVNRLRDCKALVVVIRNDPPLRVTHNDAVINVSFPHLLFSICFVDRLMQQHEQSRNIAQLVAN